MIEVLLRAAEGEWYGLTLTGLRTGQRLTTEFRIAVSCPVQTVRRRGDFENTQLFRKVVILRLPILEGAKRGLGAGQELEE
jgi:hypothetical protein